MIRKISARLCQSALVTLGLLMPPASAWSAGNSFNNYPLDYVFPGDTRGCVFFRLVGLGEADPGVPGSAWFALPKTHPLFRESYALLLSAKLTGQRINVSTTGAIDPCGHAQVLAVALPGQ